MTQNEETFETFKKKALQRHHKIKFAMGNQIEKTFNQYGKKIALDELKRLQSEVAKRPPTPDSHERMESINALKKIINSQP